MQCGTQHRIFYIFLSYLLNPIAFPRGKLFGGKGKSRDVEGNRNPVRGGRGGGGCSRSAFTAG